MALHRPINEKPLADTDTFPSDKELERLFQEAVQGAVAAHLADGSPIYYGGTGAEAGKLFMRLPGGRRFEYRLHEDGTREVIREVPS